jgi:cytidyltransferase-like protein
MFITELFEDSDPVEKTVVIMPGGFHPFHTGHLSLYNAAKKAFPEADIYVAATDDTSARPIPFKLKEKLAEIAGIPKGHFVQVRSPFRALEITSKFNPETTALIFVRSEKDKDSQPKPGGVKKDGTPGYLQPLTRDLKPMTQHGYMAYLPTIRFQAGKTGITSATEIRQVWPTANTALKQQIVQDLYPRVARNPTIINQIVGLLDGALK